MVFAGLYLLGSFDVYESSQSDSNDQWLKYIVPDEKSEPRSSLGCDLCPPPLNPHGLTPLARGASKRRPFCPSLSSASSLFCCRCWLALISVRNLVSVSLVLDYEIREGGGSTGAGHFIE
jgi:hypothetical protein